MLTRGYFIGEIIDALSDIEGQLKTRAKLGLTELHKHAEDFFVQILNMAFSYSLTNLNNTVTNAPGLDLVDAKNGIAFQITAEKSSAKVNDTLSKISDDDFAQYPIIFILMIGGKQNTYQLDDDLCAKRNFNVKKIWDIHVICKKLMELPADTLQSIYELVKSEIVRIKIELEIPDVEGRYPTNLENFIEAIPKPQLSDFTRFNQFLNDEGIGEGLEETSNKFTDLSNRLSRIPRITREFMATLIERREVSNNRGNIFHLGRGDRIEINYDILARIASRYNDLEGEIRILEANDFLIIDERGNQNESTFIVISITAEGNDYDMTLIKFVEENNINLRSVLVSLDFSTI